MDLDEHLSSSDKEMVEYVPKLFEIAYTMMLDVYNDIHPEEPLDLRKDIATEKQAFDELLNEADTGYLDKLFLRSSRLPNEEFIS